MAKNSYESLKRYKDKTYKKISIDLHKDFAEAWENKLKEDNITKAEFLRNAINTYLGSTEK